jgi:hypothetical protein
MSEFWDGLWSHLGIQKRMSMFFILRQMDKRKELIKLSKPISELSSIMTKMIGIVYYH